MPECIFVEMPTHCTSCSVADKLMCLINHGHRLVSEPGKKILRDVLEAEMVDKRRIKGGR